MNIKNIVDYGVYAAILLIIGLTPQIGFIKIGPIAVSTMMLPIVVLITHKKYVGIIFGFFMWGITSFISMFYISQTFILLGVGPAILTLIGSRILAILPILLIFYILQKIKFNKYLKSYFLSLIIGIINTFFVFLFILIFQMFDIYLFKNKKITIPIFFSINAINIILEWTVLPFIGASISFIGFHLKEKEKNVKKNSF